MLGLCLLAAGALLPAAQAMRGPDADSYYWLAQGDPGGPTYNFQDIVASGTRAAFVTCPAGGASRGPDITVPVPLQFHAESPLSFYGRSYQNVRIDVNGQLAFEPPGTVSGLDDCDAYWALCGIATTSVGWLCPGGSVATPNYQVAAMWTGLGMNASDPRSGVYYETVCHDGDADLSHCPGPCRDPDPNVPYDPNSNACRIFIVEWYDLRGCWGNQNMGTSCPANQWSTFTCSTCRPPRYSESWVNASGPNTFEAKLFEGSGKVEVHFMATALADAGFAFGPNPQTLTVSHFGSGQGIVMGVEGSGQRSGRLWHGIAFKDTGNIGMSGAGATWKPKTSWAIEYVQDHAPVADFENFSVPPNLYHDGRHGDDPCDRGVMVFGCGAPWPNPEPAYFHGSDWILFQDRSSDLDGKADIVNWTWTFGDGSSSYVPNPSHNYHISGVASYTVTETVTDRMGIVGKATRTVDIYPNRAPHVDFAPPELAQASVPTILRDTSNDTDGKVVEWSWDFGDNQVLMTAVGGPVQHTYAQTGTYPVSLRACDDDGACQSAHHWVDVVLASKAGQNVLEDRPTAYAGPAARVLPGTLVGLSGYETNGRADAYRWKQVSGPGVALEGDATRSPSFTAPTLRLGPEGRLEPVRLAFALVVTDNGRESDPATVVVTVAGPDRPPVARAGAPQSVDPGANVVLDGSQTSDPDGDPVAASWTQISGPEVVLADASSLHPSFMAPPAGELLFALRADDGAGGVDSQTVAVTVASPAPGFTAVTQGASVLFRPTQAAQAYRWTFGDGSESLDAAPEHTYATQGSYEVRLEATDMQGSVHAYVGAVHAYLPAASSRGEAQGRPTPGPLAAGALVAIGAALGRARRRGGLGR
ncbi:MAG: PKD domain-containing protein [Thermoplasmatota archaeon]